MHGHSTLLYAPLKWNCSGHGCDCCFSVAKAAQPFSRPVSPDTPTAPTRRVSDMRPILGYVCWALICCIASAHLCYALRQRRQPSPIISRCATERMHGVQSCLTVDTHTCRPELPVIQLGRYTPLAWCHSTFQHTVATFGSGTSGPYYTYTAHRNRRRWQASLFSLSHERRLLDGYGMHELTQYKQTHATRYVRTMGWYTRGWDSGSRLIRYPDWTASADFAQYM